MADNSYEFSGAKGPEEPKPKDIDLDHDSPHHTLGAGPLQAASGVHKHTVKDVTDMPSDGLPHTHTEYSPTTHGHPAVTNADTVDGQHLNWSDRGTMPTYIWGATNYGDGHLIYIARFDERFASAGHGHSYAAVSHGNHPATWATSVVTASGAGNATVYGSDFSVPVICNGDSGAQPGRAPTIYNWWNNGFTSQNWNSGACRVNWIGC